jgi:hypothetical protein
VIVVRADDHVFRRELRIAPRKNAYYVCAVAVDFDYIRFELSGDTLDRKSACWFFRLRFCVCQRTAGRSQNRGRGVTAHDRRRNPRIQEVQIARAKGDSWLFSALTKTTPRAFSCLQGLVLNSAPGWVNSANLPWGLSPSGLPENQNDLVLRIDARVAVESEGEFAVAGGVHVT